MSQVKVTCNGETSYAAIVDTPFGQISVHAEAQDAWHDADEVVIYVEDDETLRKICVVDGFGMTHRPFAGE
jgi:hypothetical protein